MITTSLSLLGVLLVGLAAFGAVFVGGMRAKWPPVVDRVRYMNRYLNRGQMDTAGQPGAFAAVLRHTGRTSGRTYETPLSAEPFGDGFAIVIVYGARTDWVRNVMAAGGAEITYDGQTTAVERPEIVPVQDVSEAFTRADRVYQRLLSIESALILHRAPDTSEDSAANA